MTEESGEPARDTEAVFRLLAEFDNMPAGYGRRPTTPRLRPAIVSTTDPAIAVLLLEMKEVGEAASRTAMACLEARLSALLPEKKRGAEKL